MHHDTYLIGYFCVCVYVAGKQKNKQQKNEEGRRKKRELGATRREREAVISSQESGC